MPELKKSSSRISPKSLSNLKVVVLCILTATTFWILNALNKDDYTTVVDFPIEFIYDSEKYVPVSPLPKSFQAEINGNGWDLLRKYFNINESPYPVELENPESNDFILTSDLKRSLTDFLSPTQLLSVLDDSLFFDIDRIITARLRPVLDSSSFTLAKNHKILSKIDFEPNQVTIRGPRSILDAFEGVFPIYLDEKRIENSLSKGVGLESPPEFEKLITIEEDEIKVSFEVVAFLEGNKRLPLKKENFPNSTSIENEDIPFMFYYLVDEREVTKLGEMEFEAIVNYSRRNKTDSTIEVQVKPIPNFLELIKIEPSSVRIKYD